MSSDKHLKYRIDEMASVTYTIRIMNDVSTVTRVHLRSCTELITERVYRNRRSLISSVVDRIHLFYLIYGRGRRADQWVNEAVGAVKEE